jgi:hypothetical protein
MRRRNFIAGLGSAAAWPFAARAQRPTVPTVGYLGTGSLVKARSIIAAVDVCFPTCHALYKTLGSGARLWPRFFNATGIRRRWRETRPA